MEGSSGSSPLPTGDLDDSDWMSLDDASSMLDAGEFAFPIVDSGVLSPSKMVADASSPGRSFDFEHPAVDNPAGWGATTVLDVEAIMQRATVDFLTKSDVAAVLANVERLGIQISADVAQTPPSGSLVFYNKKTTKRFRDDGYVWRRKKGGRQVQEYHEKLKIGGVEVLTVCYTKLAADPDFQRRVYWLLEKGRSHWVLVHYLGKRLVTPTARAPSTATTAPPPSNILGHFGHQPFQMGEPLGSHSAAPDAGLRSAAPMGTPVDALAAAPDFATVSNQVAPGDAVVLPMQDGDDEAVSSSGEAGIHLVDCSPDWAYVDGGQKVIIVYDVTPPVAAQDAIARYTSGQPHISDRKAHYPSSASLPAHHCLVRAGVCVCSGQTITVCLATCECRRKLYAQASCAVRLRQPLWTCPG